MNTTELLARLYSAPLPQLLTQALAVAQQHSDATFEHWLRLELFGYFHSNPALKAADKVPGYRTVVGEHSDEFGRPLIISDPQLGFVNEIRVRWGVAELEELRSRGGHITVRDPFTADVIRKHLHVEVSRFSFDSRELTGVLSAIRTQLAEHLARHQHSPVPLVASNLPGRSEEIFEIKPNLWGIGINVRALGRRVSAWWGSRRRTR